MKVSANITRWLLPAAIILVAGCYNDKADQLYPEPPAGGNACDTAAVSYATAVKPVIKQYCTDPGCHSGSGTTGSYLLNTYEGVKLSADNNRLLGAIRHDNGFVAMPAGMAKLTSCDINKITAWVNQGKQNN
ncbi:MAG: hypothetical protein JNL72_04285 [Flavipsychrobacter sp.]|nr:hypothetical protein [Flavipsychrobacter sp.]